MWTIYQGVTGYVYSTTKEKELLTNPYYLVKMVHDSTKNAVYMVCSDLSNYPTRNQKFLIKETNTPVSAYSQVKLDHKRSWKYFIYETATVNVVNETGLNEVERGRAKVYEVTATELQKYDNNQSTYKETLNE